VNDYDDVLDLRPMCDHHSRQVIEQALATLGDLRGLDPDHPAVRLHLLTSLTSQTQAGGAPGVPDSRPHRVGGLEQE
jgi:hypothetical protein